MNGRTEDVIKALGALIDATGLLRTSDAASDDVLWNVHKARERALAVLALVAAERVSSPDE